MKITVFSVASCNGHYRARARAVAEDATIRVEVKFRSDNRTDVWREARDQVLRYLDIN